jgi:peptidoglycan L-alanyl-D-glutamate endopeptidase CwlK
MPKFGEKSFDNLMTCNTDLVFLFSEVVKEFDCSVLEGSRGAFNQMKYYHSGRSKIIWPLGKHNANGIDIQGVSEILRCQPTIDDIVKSIVVAREEQLFAIDELDPLEKSNAVDVVPYPLDWRFENDLMQSKKQHTTGEWIRSLNMDVVHNMQRWFKFGGFVLGMAQKMDIPLIWGGDWDGDHQMSDQRFDDLPHFELMG